MPAREQCKEGYMFHSVSFRWSTGKIFIDADSSLVGKKI
jgi:hypothetical protein